MKRILVACGNGIATSTVVATKVREYLQQHGIDVSTTQTKLMEVPGKVQDYDLLVTTGQFDGQTGGVPVIKGMPILTGIGADQTMEEILIKGAEKMKIIMNVFNFFIDAGPTVMLPVIITIIGLIFGLKISRAFKSGLTLGIGFAGIKLILDFMTTNVGPAAKAMVDRTGVKLDALDVGWGSIAAVTWASPIIPILIFAILLVNIVLLILKRTHMAIVGVMVYFVTKNVFLGVGASVVMAIATFKISDWSQPMVESFFGIPGVSLPTVSALSSLVIAWPLNWLLDRIPLFRKSKFTIKDAQKYLGFFGDSMIMGLVIGMVIGVLAGYDIKAVLQLGVSMSAVLVLIPKMTSLFMEGLMPISDAAQKWSQKNSKVHVYLSDWMLH